MKPLEYDGCSYLLPGGFDTLHIGGAENLARRETDCLQAFHYIIHIYKIYMYCIKYSVLML